jgi:hypothetical protein
MHRPRHLARAWGSSIALYALVALTCIGSLLFWLVFIVTFGFFGTQLGILAELLPERPQKMRPTKYPKDVVVIVRDGKRIDFDEPVSIYQALASKPGKP